MVISVTYKKKAQKKVSITQLAFLSAGLPYVYFVYFVCASADCKVDDQSQIMYVVVLNW